MGPVLDGWVRQIRGANACAAVRSLIAALGLISALGACSSEPRLSTMSDAGDDGSVPEDCDTPGDEDGNGVADCEDPACGAAPACTPVCGNGRLEAGEECDDGNRRNSDGCESDCRLPYCGNGTLDEGEHCDDGNRVDGDGCENDCSVPVCGNAIVDANEQCDDGGHGNGDGCDSVCRRSAYTYVKASNAAAADTFGASIAISADGSTLAVGAPGESSSATGVNGDQQDNSAPSAGAVYVFVRAGNTWVQQAYLKGSVAPAFDQFGWSVALSADGSTLAVGAPAADAVPGPGAAYVFRRSGGVWSEPTRIGPANPSRFDEFGWSVAVSGDGLTLAIGAPADASNATGIDGDPANASMEGSGAVHVYRAGASWTHEAYIKASNTWPQAGLGQAVALSGDGACLVVGAPTENSDATGIGGDQTNHRAPSAGAVYAFTRVGTTWAQQAYIKGANTAMTDVFGSSVALSSDATTLAVGAVGESSSATGVNGDSSNNAAPASGAAYVFVRGADTWTQQAYVKASNTASADLFGWSIALSPDGSALAVGAEIEDSASTGINGEQRNNNATAAGAVFRYTRNASTWHQAAYIKATNTGAGDAFGVCVALAVDATLAVGATGEDSDATGIAGDQTNNRARGAGAVYVLQ